MNYIHRLQAENAELQERITEARQALIDLSAYLASSKFREDTTVQKQDVINRIAPALEQLAE